MAMMVDGPIAANAGAYVKALSGWQRERGTKLRTANHAAGPFAKSIKCTNPSLVERMAAEVVKLNAELRDPNQKS